MKSIFALYGFIGAISALNLEGNEKPKKDADLEHFQGVVNGINMYHDDRVLKDAPLPVGWKKFAEGKEGRSINGLAQTE